MKFFSFLLLIWLVLGCGSSTKEAEKINQLPQVVFSNDVAAFGLSEVELTPSISDIDGTIVSYKWRQTSGPAIELVNSHSQTLIFIAPDIAYGEGEQQLQLQLTVQDNDGGEASASVTVLIKPLLTVDAGDDQSLFVGESLDIGCDTTFYDGVDYHLTQTSGPFTIQINTSADCFTSLSQFNEVGEYTFTLQGSDDSGQTASDTIQANVGGYTGQINKWVVPSDLVKLAIINKDLAPANDLQTYGDFLYAISDDSVAVLSVGGDENVLEHQRLESIENLYVKDDYAFGLTPNGDSSTISSYKLTSGLFEQQGLSHEGNLSENAKIVLFEQQLLVISDDSLLYVYRVNDLGITLVDEIEGIQQQQLQKILILADVLYVQTYGVFIYKINESSLEFIDDIFYSGFDYGGVVEDIYIEQEQLFVIGYGYDSDGPYDNELRVYDTSDIRNISRLSITRIDKPNYAGLKAKLTINNDYVYVLASNGFYIYRNENGVLENIYSSKSYTSSILYHEGYVYLSSKNEIQVIDVNEPQPKLLCHYAMGSMNSAIKTITSEYAYVLSSNSKLLVVPVSQLNQACASTYEQHIESAQISDSFLLKGENTLLVPTKNNTIELWAIDNNGLLVKQSKQITTHLNTKASPQVISSDDYVFYTDFDNSVAIASKEQITRIVSSNIEVDHSIDAMAIDGTRLLISAGRTLYFYDISDVESPKLQSQLDVMGLDGGTSTAQSIRIEGNRVFVRPAPRVDNCHWSTDRVGVYVVDISNSEQMKLDFNTHKEACTRYDFSLLDNILVSMDYHSLFLSDLSIEDDNKWISTYEWEKLHPLDITTINDVVILVNGSANLLGLQILALNESNSLELVARIPFITSGNLIAGKNNILYVNMPNLGVYIIDMSSPTMPKLLGWIHNRADNLLVGEDTLYFLRDEDLSTTSYISAKSKQWFQDNFVMSNDFREVAIGGEITYNVSWKNDMINKIDCQVTAGSCQLTAFDKQAKVAAVEWSLPDDAGEHQILINGGNDEQYATQSDLVIVN